MQNFLSGSTGQLSLITAILITGGNILRAFTTAVVYIDDPEGDWLGLVVMLKSLLCNFVILLQVILYQKSAKENFDQA